MSKEAIVKDLIEIGKSTREDLKAAAECTSGSLASYLSAFRNAAKFTGVAICPIEIEIDDGDGVKKVFVFKTFEEVEAIKAERSPAKSKAVAKTPAQRLDAATKRVTRTSNILDKAAERFEADSDNRELELRYQKAQIEAELAEIELKRASTLVAAEASAEDADEASAEEVEDLM